MAVLARAHGGVPAVDPLDQRLEFRAALAAEPLRRQKQPRPLDQTNTIRSRRALDRLLRLVAKAALGRVHDPLERQIVVGGHGETEVGHGVADFHPLVEAGAADDAVGKADCQKSVLEGPHLVARAHQDGDFVQADGPHPARALPHGFEFLADPAGLFLAVPVADEAELLALVPLGPERLAEPPLVRGDQAEAAARMCAVER